MFQDKIQKDLKQGKIKEKEFFSLINHETIESTPHEDMYDHFDGTVSVKIDVKSRKKIARSGNIDDTHHWIELRNVNGNKGWIHGKADFFAFETDAYWAIVSREKLLEFMRERVVMKHAPKGTLYHLYTRQGRKDVLVLIKSLDLFYLSSSIIEKEINHSNQN